MREALPKAPAPPLPARAAELLWDASPTTYGGRSVRVKRTGAILVPLQLMLFCTWLVVTQQGTYLDGLEDPSWRERDALSAIAVSGWAGGRPWGPAGASIAPAGPRWCCSAGRRDAVEPVLRGDG